MQYEVRHTTLALVSVAILLIMFLGDTPETLFGFFVAKFDPTIWDEANERNIVKNTIPISVIGQVSDELCKIKAEAFDRVVDHPYFAASAHLSESLGYDQKHSTLIIKCNSLR